MRLTKTADNHCRMLILIIVEYCFYTGGNWKPPKPSRSQIQRKFDEELTHNEKTALEALESMKQEKDRQ